MLVYAIPTELQSVCLLWEESDRLGLVGTSFSMLGLLTPGFILLSSFTTREKMGYWSLRYNCKSFLRCSEHTRCGVQRTLAANSESVPCLSLSVDDRPTYRPINANDQHSTDVIYVRQLLF